jgi:transposase
MEKSKMKPMPVGIDIAKNVMQVHFVNTDTGEIFNKAIKRAKFIEFFTNRSPCLIGMEACGGAHHWARQLSRLGHQVKLMPGEFVKAFNIRNKNDTADAQAIWRARSATGQSRSGEDGGSTGHACPAPDTFTADEVPADADQCPARFTLGIR